jgi:metallo-beta-lactamase class B
LLAILVYIISSTGRLSYYEKGLAMKEILIICLIMLMQLSVFAQPGDTIRISTDIELIKISENAYVHVSYYELPSSGRFPSNGLIFINQGQAILFDTPWTDSMTRELITWISDSLKLKIVGFVPNHSHPDCMGGLGYLQSIGIESYANQLTIEIAEAKNLPVPAHGFKDSLQLSLGDKIVNCYYLGAAHSMDNIVVWIPSEQILFPGCMIKSKYVTDLGNTNDGDLIAYPKTIEKLLNKFPTAKYVIPGHGAFGGLDLIRHTKELLK